MTRWRLAVGIALALLAAGCLGGGGQGEDAETASQPEQSEAEANASRAEAQTSDELWGEDERLTIVNATWTDSMAFEADVLCASGGAPLVDRTSERVLPGTGELEVFVDASDTGMGYQAGYVLDPDAAAHAADQEGITWLDSVAPGGQQTFTVDVGEDETEAPGEPRPWAFYLRVNPGVDELCYTGFSLGPGGFVVEAVQAT